MISSKKWDDNYVPFCGEEDSMLVINASDGGVYEWDSDDGLGDNVAASFASFLVRAMLFYMSVVENVNLCPSFQEDYRNALLGGQMEYLSGCGVVEKMGAGGGSRK
jgi:hypothetical protein